MDLHELIERSIDQPSPLVLSDHVRDGRRALRRRRTPFVMATGVIVAAVATFAVAAPLQPSQSTTTTAATSPSAAPAANPPLVHNPAPSDEQPAGYDANGDLTIQPGWTIVQRINQPVTVPVDDSGQQRLPAKSVALTLTNGERTQWVLSWWSGNTASGSYTDSSPTNTGQQSLQDFVDIEVAISTETATDAIANVGADDTMTGLNGVQVVSQQATPQLDRAGATTTVARATFPGEPRGKGWVLLVRSGDTVRTYPILFYPVVNSQTDDGPDTIAGFVHWIAPRVAEGRFP